METATGEGDIPQGEGERERGREGGREGGRGGRKDWEKEGERKGGKEGRKGMGEGGREGEGRRREGWRKNVQKNNLVPLLTHEERLGNIFRKLKNRQPPGIEPGTSNCSCQCSTT